MTFEQHVMTVLQGMEEFFEPWFDHALELEDVVVVPLRPTSTVPEILENIISINEAEKLEAFQITELEVEDVNRLQVANHTGQYVFIPAFHMIEGGKQDRIVAKPIIVPPMEPQDEPLMIPVFCVESGRWHYDAIRTSRARRRFSSSHSRLSLSSSRMALESPTQHVVWNSVERHSDALRLPRHVSPSRSHRIMKERMRMENKDYRELLTKLQVLREMKDISGVTVFMNGTLMYMETMGSSRLWQQVSMDVADLIADESLLRRYLQSEFESPLSSMNVTEAKKAWNRWLITLKHLMPTNFEQVKIGNFEYVVAQLFTPDREWSVNITMLPPRHQVHVVAFQDTPLKRLGRR